MAVRMEARHTPLLVWALLVLTDTEVTRWQTITLIRRACDPHTADHPFGDVHGGAGTCDDGHGAGILLVHEFLVFGVYLSMNSPGVPSAVEA
ncbi:hypothetical protein [Streptomyces sp. NBC_00568]|uniref:hypothetical protein n=1 Tax=Streptomyces sp. NBC_00568 TaxID=2975779 RepID=UPI00225A0BEC|nr:hypothetical protein [Streptomyces sp. NBC_00568]MCX4993503.1 hypothetical protein [Streptomyces sp. NBC_00568]